MKIINVEGMHCDNCAKRIKKALESLDNVLDVTVNLSKKEVILNGDVSNKEIKECIEDLDYEVKKIRDIKRFK